MNVFTRSVTESQRGEEHRHTFMQAIKIFFFLIYFVDFLSLFPLISYCIFYMFCEYTQYIHNHKSLTISMKKKNEEDNKS